MVYEFNDIKSDKIVNDSRVLFIFGKYPVFNHLLIDSIRETCVIDDDIDLSDFSDLGDFSQSTGSEDLNFDDYLLYCNSVNINGQWFCCTDYKMLTSKQKSALDTHIKHPAKYGKLIIVITEFKSMLEIMKKGVKSSKNVNLIKLNYPRRGVLEDIVVELFKKQGTNVAPQAVQLFIMRMGIAYDKYSEQIARLSNGSKELSFEAMQQGLRGCTMYALSDFMLALLKPTNSDKVVKSRKAYKILNTLIPELGAQTVLRRLYYEVQRMVEYRVYINNGAIPVLVPYNIDKVRNRIPESSKLNKASDYAFKREALIASRTSLKDWIYIYLIILNGLRSNSEIGAYRALMACVHRNAVSNDRILNDLGLKDVINEALVELNMMGVSGIERKTETELIGSSH